MSFKDGQVEDPPSFDHPTESHMPQCGGVAAFCSGSGTYTHLGLQLIKNNQVAYHNAATMMGAQYPANDETIYFNILITDGQYNMYSTDAQVMAELQQMYNNGITTYVIGFGDGVNSPAAMTQLNNMADWGSGNMLNYYDANNQADLEMALATIFGGLVFDPCCAFNDCSENPEPTTEEPDPGMATFSSSSTTNGDGDGDGDPDAGTLDGDADASVMATEIRATVMPMAGPMAAPMVDRTADRMVVPTADPMAVPTVDRTAVPMAAPTGAERPMKTPAARQDSASATTRASTAATATATSIATAARGRHSCGRASGCSDYRASCGDATSSGPRAARRTRRR